MFITFQLPPPVHEGPQFARLRRSPSPHPRVIPTEPKSGKGKAVGAVKDYFKTPCGIIKHWLHYGPRNSDVFRGRYPVHQQKPLKALRVVDEDKHYELELFPDRKLAETNSKLKTSSVLGEDDTLYDSGVDLPEAKKIQSHLVVKDDSVAWWKTA